MAADSERTAREFLKLALRASSPGVCSAFLLAALMAQPGLAAVPEGERLEEGRSIAERVAAVRERFAREPRGRTYELRQDLAQWFNWGNGWNNWRNW